MKNEKNNSTTTEMELEQQQQALTEWLQNRHLFCGETLRYLINGNSTSDSWRKKQYQIKGSKELVDNAIEVAELYIKLGLNT